MVGLDAYGSVLDPLNDPAFFWNHSCDGNCWYDSDNRLVAKRDIQAGEHVVYDYALTETEASLHAGMECMCGSVRCRGVLRFDQYRDPEWVKENEGHMMSHIALKAKEMGWHHPAVHPMRLGTVPLPPAAAAVTSPSARADASNEAAAAAATKTDASSCGDAGSASSGGACRSSSSRGSSEGGSGGSGCGGASDGGDVGLGLFALRPLSKGEVVLFFGGKVVGKDEFLKTQRMHPTMHFLQVAPCLWMVPTSNGPETPDYINHSCEPNCGLLDSVTVVTLRDVDEGEELTFDYGTCMDESIEDTGLETFECRCGAPTCRGVVTPRDYRRPSVQRRCRGYFPPFLTAKLASGHDGTVTSSQQQTCQPSDA